MSFLTSYTDIKAEIISKLEDIDGDDSTKLLADVYGVAETEPSGFPTAYVLEQAGQGQIIDTHRNEREWQFGVKIYQEIGNKTPEQAYEILLDAVDKIISSFDKDPTLEDDNDLAQCKWVKVVPMDFEYVIESTAFQTATLTIAVVNLVNRYSV